MNDDNLVVSTRIRRKRRPAGQRAFPVSSTIDGAFEDGKSDIEELKEEISEWKDNLEGNNMEHLPKYEEVSECCENLETAVDAFEEVDLPECLSGVLCNYTRDTRQSATSRAGRMSNAYSALDAAKSAAEQWLEENPELELYEGDTFADELDNHQTIDEDAVDQREEDRSNVESFIEKVQEGLDALDSVSFPGMY